MSASENTGRVTASVNTLAGEIVDRLVAGAERYRVAVSRGSLGELLIDAGANDAGRRRRRPAAHGNLHGRARQGHALASVAGRRRNGRSGSRSRSNDPVVACLASQYAGWSLSHEKFFALGSGPGRARRASRSCFEEHALQGSRPTA